ncbi:MAG: type III-A CRISPR-associated protein Cas10/Csm1 [Firmicutes bacterium]|nr:type III-A CRISPR-associated protein Cas10/Csm1 [Bacillota bacterium]
MQRDTLYIAALLHDIGKFIERSKSYKGDDKFKHIRVGHPKYSAQLLDVLKKKSLYFQAFSDDLIDLVLFHHEPRSDWETIIQLADWLSSSEREEGDTQEKYYTVPLRPIFSRLFDQQINEYGYSLAPLSISSGFPDKNPTITIERYKKIVDSFLGELSEINNEIQLYFLLEKYLWCVPAQTTNYIPDISLFDHAKTTAAIALCLYDEYKEGHLTSESLKQMSKNSDNHFMLINGDVSGIQDFIFNIPSKGAAKTLKGHSVYISLLTDALTRYLTRQLNLKEANILYNGGGNFYILAPKVCEEKFVSLRKNISQQLLKFHGGAIYVALDYILLSPENFTEFNLQWEKVKEKVNAVKNKKWAEIGLQENYHAIFGPFGYGSKDNTHCQLCGIEQGEREIKYDPETEKNNCTFCASFMELTNDIKDADCLVIKEVKENNKETVTNYQDVFNAFGWEYSFTTRQKVNQEEKKNAYLLNDTEFIKDGFRGFRFGAYRLPYKYNDNERKNQQLTFEEISEKSTGDPKLALLKLDVDNLGSLFLRGLGKKSTISRVASLSRMLALYFEGYINHLIMEKNWQDYLYIVFSGGDDTFIVGAWDKVLDFTQEFYKKFHNFTCHHPQVTFSAGICIFRFNYPIIMSSQMTEEALENAKSRLEPGKAIPSKDKVSLFGEVFNWTEFDCIRSFKELLLKTMINNSSKDKGEFGRAFLYKIWKSTLGFRRILQDSLQGRVDNVRFWRLAYYLRDVAREDADRLIEEYRKIVINNILGKNIDEKVGNIMVVPAAVKWAQMETRKVRGKKE